MSLSDLDLVQQAMAPTEPGAVAHNANGNGTTAPAPITTASTTSTAAAGPAHADPLDGLDLSKLSAQDREALQPILDALRAASGGGDDGDVEDILKQLDAAGDVADTLEGRLDALLESLGAMEDVAVEECEVAGKPVPPKK